MVPSRGRAPTGRRETLILLAAGLALSGCGPAPWRPPGGNELAVLDWSLQRQGDALSLSGHARNQTARNLNGIVVEAVFYGPGGRYLGSVVARSTGRSFPPGAVAAFAGLGVYVEGMVQPEVVFRDLRGQVLTAETPSTQISDGGAP